MTEKAYVRLAAWADIAYGEDLVVCGSTPALGSWDVSRAAPMTWQEGSRWVLEAPMPTGVRLELKVVVRRQGGNFSWHGAGDSGADNVILETSLGRAGARGSRLEGGKPFDLKVEDIAGPTAMAVPEGAEGGLINNQPANNGPLMLGNGGPEQSQPQNYGGHQNNSQLAVHGGDQPGYGAHGGSGGGGAPFAMPAVAPPIEVQMAAVLAGQAANFGQQVTYTTTSVTTTSVTIGAGGTPAAGVPQAYAPPPPTPNCPPQGGGYSPGSPVGKGRAGVGAAGGPPCPPDGQPTFDDEKINEARDHNSFVERMGPVALHWPGSDAKRVMVQGSWDNWESPLALEPAPGGGWRLLMVLPPGEYELKFIVDGDWLTSDQHEVTNCNNQNNVVCASNAALAPTVRKKGNLMLGDAQSAISQAIAIPN